MNAPLGALRSAQKQAAKILRTWHLLDGRDLTDFEGYSLATLARFDMGFPMGRIARQAALGKDPAAADFLNDGTREKYSDLPEFSLSWQRTDWKARGFRTLYRLARLAARPTRAKRVLVIGSTANRALWNYWLAHEDELCFGLDFALRNPPGFPNALKAVSKGARMFDPRPRGLTDAQRRRIAEIRAAITSLASRSQWREEFVIGGKDVFEPFRREILDPFAAKLDGLAVKCLSFADEFGALRPDAVLLPEDSTPDACLLTAAAHKHGVPVWLLDDGFPTAGYTVEDILVGGNIDSDLILAWSPQNKGNYLSIGIPESRLAVAGQSAFDVFFPAAPARPVRSVRGATILVLSYIRPFGTTLYLDGVEERFFRETSELLGRLGAGKILFKIHPGIVRKEFFEKLAAGLDVGCPVELLREEGFHEVLARADAVIGPISTAIFETMLSGKDYYFLHYDPHDIPAPLEPGNAFVARTIEDLESNIIAGRCVPRERVLTDYLGLDGTEKPWHFTRRVFERLSAALLKAERVKC